MGCPRFWHWTSYERCPRLQDRLSVLLDSGYRLPPELTRPSPDHDVNYPLHLAAGWCVAVVEWFAGGWHTP
jgi:hypothetical protein